MFRFVPWRRGSWLPPHQGGKVLKRFKIAWLPTPQPGKRASLPVAFWELSRKRVCGARSLVSFLSSGDERAEKSCWVCFEGSVAGKQVSWPTRENDSHPPSILPGVRRAFLGQVFRKLFDIQWLRLFGRIVPPSCGIVSGLSRGGLSESA